MSEQDLVVQAAQALKGELETKKPELEAEQAEAKKAHAANRKELDELKVLSPPEHD
jgi:hypothetical protein